MNETVILLEKFVFTLETLTQEEIKVKKVINILKSIINIAEINEKMEKILKDLERILPK